MSTHRFILDPTKVSVHGTLAQTATAKDVFPSTLIRKSESSSLITWGVATTNKNVVITSRLVITLNGIHWKRKSCQKIAIGAIYL